MLVTAQTASWYGMIGLVYGRVVATPYDKTVLINESGDCHDSEVLSWGGTATQAVNHSNTMAMYRGKPRQF